MLKMRLQPGGAHDTPPDSIVGWGGGNPLPTPNPDPRAEAVGALSLAPSVLASRRPLTAFFDKLNTGFSCQKRNLTKKKA